MLSVWLSSYYVPGFLVAANIESAVMGKNLTYDDLTSIICFASVKLCYGVDES